MLPMLNIAVQLLVSDNRAHSKDLVAGDQQKKPPCSLLLLAVGLLGLQLWQLFGYCLPALVDWIYGVDSMLERA